ncbi:hypothetical protein [Streptomyces sp. NPDC093094]|uniref:hypothetical protein n=1 Tax=Streptomyces sp. NPDC093094 TaxID=3366026 RepID=UPI003822FFD2
MSDDRTTADRGPGIRPRPRSAGWVRAGLFALLGSVLAALGHHTVAEGPVPWRLVAALGAAQFALVLPFARRRLPLWPVVSCTLAAQGAQHLVLSRVGGHGTGPGRTGHAGHPGHAVPAAGDGHAWHHAGTAMTVTHVLAAVAVAWLLHRADSAVTLALAAARAGRGVAAALLARLRTPRPAVAGGRPRSARPVGRFEGPAPPTAYLLDHALVRRGPPGRTRVPDGPSPGRGFGLPGFCIGKESSLCPRPRTSSAAPRAGWVPPPLSR